MHSSSPAVPGLVFLVSVMAGCGSGSGGTDGCTPAETRSCYSGPAGTVDVGACHTGAQVCGGDGVWSACVSEVIPAVEGCDGLDDDCDGTTDEGDPGGGEPCDTGLQGVCAGGTTACSGGEVRCVQDLQASTEACNGLDDSCDGAVDEGCQCIDDRTESCYSGAPSTLGVGPCVAGQHACSGGQWGSCLGEVVPTTESCNGLDDNCEGQTDEGFSLVLRDGTTVHGVGASCGTGLCDGGTTLCKADGSGITCSTEGQASAEICDGIDNDCNGVTDEEDATGCSVYFRDQEPDGYGLGGDGRCLCTALGQYTTLQSGDCNDGNAAIHPGANERCNGLDDDCNGMTDASDAAALTGAYLTQDQPLCELQQGVCAGARKIATLCASGSWTSCTAAAYAAHSGQYEGGELTRDGLDNDCDGQTDEGFPPP